MSVSTRDTDQLAFGVGEFLRTIRTDSTALALVMDACDLSGTTFKTNLGIATGCVKFKMTRFGQLTKHGIVRGFQRIYKIATIRIGLCADTLSKLACLLFMRQRFHQ